MVDMSDIHSTNLFVQLKALHSIADAWVDQGKEPSLIYWEMVQYAKQGHLTANILPMMCTVSYQFQSIGDIESRCKQFQKDAKYLLEQLHAISLDAAILCQINSVLAVGTTSTLLNAELKDYRQRFVVKAIDKVQFNAYCNRWSSSLKVRTELEVLKKCNHQLIPAIHDVYDTDKTLYIVMEHCGEKNLLDYIFEVGSLKKSDCAVLARDIFTALDYLRLLEIVHRDVKPANLTLYAEAVTLQLKLIDFGLAKASPCSTFIGTRGYMAPEIYLTLDRGNYGTAVDAWAGGVTMYEMITTETPFNHDKVREETLAGYIDFQSPEWNKVPVSAKQLVASLLTSEVAERATSFQVLRHTWLQCL